MYKITLNRKLCVNCGNCNYYLEKHLASLKAGKKILITKEEFEREEDLLANALQFCYLDAVLIEKINES